MKKTLIFLLFHFTLFFFAQQSEAYIDVKNDVGVPVRYIKINQWENKLTMSDKYIDGFVYIKNNGTFYKRNYEDHINVLWFKLKKDNNDDTLMFQRAIAFMKSIGGGVLYIPKGEYSISKTLTIDFDNLVMQGEGSKNSILKIKHSSIGIYYKSKVPDLSTARFNVYGIGLLNTINNSNNIPSDKMSGTGIYCKEMHSSDWKDVYIENFLDAFILDESYLNIIINYFAQSNWRGVKTIGGSNGNTFYNGAQRNSSLDLRGKGSEKNLFINIDIEPASNTQYVGNNNTFQNCRFERFNLLSKVFNRPWFVLGSDNKFTKCDWYWNFEDQPLDYMMVVEGQRNEIEISKTVTTPKLIIFKTTSSNNTLKYSAEFNDLTNTNTLRYSANLIQDLGLNNKIEYSFSSGTSNYLGSSNVAYKGDHLNMIEKNWADDSDINMKTLEISKSDKNSPLGFSKEYSKKIIVSNQNYVRRIKFKKSIITDGETKYAASAWVYIPKDFKGKFVSVSIVEGQYIMLDVSQENREKWIRVYGFAQPISGTAIQFCIDTDATKGSFFYVALPSLSRDLSASAIYE